MLKKVWLHFKLITRHRWIVFKLCCRVGMPWRGLVHDLSKYGFAEFFESAKYYVGYKSPIQVARQERQYSLAWLHHKGRNKHHPEYWVDLTLPEKTVIMPYKYAAEMICDKMAAGIVYQGKDWNKDWQITYYMRERERILIHPQVDKFLMATFTMVSEKDLDATITKNNIKELYEKYCVRMENLDENKI